jgi:hypothetical protein
METYCSIDLNIKPFIPLETYQALREQNRAVFARLDDLESQMRDIPRTQAGYAPRTPDQEKRVQDFLAVRGQIQFLPDFYFRDISLEWLGDDTFMRQPRDPAVRAEYQQVAARVKSILTPYPG